MTRAHSIISASSAHRWLNCPGSVRLTRDLPDTAGMAAMEGTAAHELGEKCLRDGSNAVEHIGVTIPVEEAELSHAFIVDQEMVDGVQLYLDTVRGDLDSLQPGCEMVVEERFHLKHLHEDLFGTNDAMIAQMFGRLVVHDFKYGAGVAVEPVENEQMMIYGLGGLHRFPTCESVELVIDQPRAAHSSGPIRRWQLGADELKKWGDVTLVPGAKLALTGDAPLKSGTWCKKSWCDARPICPAHREMISASAVDAFGVDPVEVEIPLPDPATLTPEQLGKILAFQRVFSGYATAVETYTKAAMERGTEVPGWKLVKGRASRKWIDEGAVIVDLAAHGDKIYSPRKLRTPAQMEKLIAKEELTDYIETSRGISMAPADDKRAAIAPAIDAFKKPL